MAAVLVAALATVSAAVSAFTVNQDSALTVPQSLDAVLGATFFPVEFLVAPIPVELSSSFMADSDFTSVTAEVWVECVDAALFPDTEWMGDLAYLAPQDPNGVVPGGGDAGPVTPSVTGSDPNAPWLYIGGNPRNCPGNSIGVLTQAKENAIFLDKSAGGDTSATLFLGLDVPLCKLSFNLPTNPTSKPSGWSLPTLVLKKGDPRFERESTDARCNYDMGMDLKIIPVAIN